MIKCYVINLKRRVDRLSKIEKNLKSVGIKFERFDATDALRETEDILNTNLELNGPLGLISKGDKACFQSHSKLWNIIALTETKPVLILEDDVQINNGALDVLKNIDWIPSDMNIIKCERFGNSRHKILVSPSLKKFGVFNLYYLWSKHSGTGAYIISPKGAKILCNQKKKVNVSVDHYLFNPNNSNVFKKLKPLQLLPAICEQIDEVSDIHPLRNSFSYLKFSDIFREIKRGYFEIKLIPYQLLLIVFKGAKLIKPFLLK